MFESSILAVGLLAAWLGNGGGEGELERFESERTLMGTTFRIVVYCEGAAVAERAFEASFARVAALEKVMSDYDPESEVSLVSARSGDGPIGVSGDLFDVLSYSDQISRKTDGAFDVTVGPVVRLWRRSQRTRMLPSRESLAESMERVGYRLMRLDSDRRTVELMKRGMKLDLGGVGKGWAGDEVIAFLKGVGVSRALVSAAGDVVVSGPPPGERGWRVSVASAKGLGARAVEVLLLTDGAVSTSGDLERFVEIDGVRYSHIVDPKTGLGAVDRASVTVVAARGRDTDALATAVYVMGAERGEKLICEWAGASALYQRVVGDRVGERKMGDWEKIEKVHVTREKELSR